MTTISITGKQPGKTAVTISSTVNPAVKNRRAGHGALT